MANKVCDFCLEEGRGLFHQPERLPDGHYICKNCRKIITSYDLPVKYDLFQLLVISEPYMQEMMMGDYLEHHRPEDAIAKYYPTTPMILHQGEHVVNMRPASIIVERSKIPADTAVKRIGDIGRKEISNISNTRNSDGVEVEGSLYETDAALYFLSEHFINCHRLTSVITEHIDTDAVHVLEHGRQYSYKIKHADLFHLRSVFYHMAVAATENREKSLIYLASENTMTLTSGRYNVPKNIKSGTYWVNPVEDATLHVRDANGRVRSVSSGRLRIDNGSVLEVDGQYEVRYNRREDIDSGNTITAGSYSNNPSGSSE